MDQATDLRVLVQQVASSRAPVQARAKRILVFGGQRGVGATTIAANLSVALAQQGQRCLLCDVAGYDVSAPQLAETSSRPETILIDVGNPPEQLARQIWQTADRVLLVSTSDSAAVMNAYASIKLWNDPARQASVALLLNRSPGDAAAEEARRRLVQACRRFLGVTLRCVGVVPEDKNVSQCAARGESFVLATPACAASIALRQLARALTNPATPRKPAAA